jgi:hypothetical protein
MANGQYPVRNEGIAWRDIAGEVLIVGEDTSRVRTLNKTASVKRLDEIAAAIYDRFEVTTEQAKADVEHFCRELLAADLITLQDSPVEG